MKGGAGGRKLTKGGGGTLNPKVAICLCPIPNLSLTRKRLRQRFLINLRSLGLFIKSLSYLLSWICD